MPSPPSAASPAARNKSYERWRWQIFGVTWLAKGGFYLTRRSFSVAKNELRNHDVMGLTKAARLANSVTYALGQVPIRRSHLPIQPPTNLLYHACRN